MNCVKLKNSYKLYFTEEEKTYLLNALNEVFIDWGSFNILEELYNKIENKKENKRNG